MTSKTAMIGIVRTWQAQAIREGLGDNPKLLEWKDERGRNWLHLAASIAWQDKPDLNPKASVATAKVLLAKGYNINQPAFTEGTWHATPLWYAVGRGRNIVLARYLLKEGSTPEHCLWAASWNDDGAMIKLLLKKGANIEAIAEGETPLLGAVKWSRFEKVEILLKAGADPDFRDRKDMTALHYMLKKGSQPAHFELFAKHGASGSIPGPDGRTAKEMLSKKRDKTYHAIAEKLK